MLQILIAAMLIAIRLDAQCTGALPLTGLTAAERAERRAVLAFGHWLAGSRVELQKRFGAPLQVRGDTARFFYVAQLDSAFEWRYRAFSVSLIKDGDSGSEVVSHVELFAQLPEAPISVQLQHSDTTRARRLLGPTARPVVRGDTVEICVPLTDVDEADEDVRLRFIRGRLTRALWSFYTG